MLSCHNSLALLLLSLLGCVLSFDQAPLLHHSSHDRRNVSAALFGELEELARVVDIAYCVGSTGWGISKPFECPSHCSEFSNFELVTTWNTGALLSDSCGYVALDHGKRRIIVAFRGTYSITNTIMDLSTVPQKYVPYPGDDEDGAPSENGTKRDTEGYRGHEKRPIGEPKCLNCSVHWGFHTSWLNTRNAILQDVQEQVFLHDDYEMNLIGHSLGGAVAALAALDFQARGWRPRVTTFGEPRIGNAALAKYLDQRFDLGKDVPEDDFTLRYRRITHVDDPVPLLPLTEWGYAMHAGEIFISKSDLTPDVQDLQHCNGDQDPLCIAGQDATVTPDGDTKPDPSHAIQARKRDLLASVKDELYEVRNEPWGIPSRYKLWQLFFAHRDYFWRIGLCIPGGDPLRGAGNYPSPREDL